MKIKITILLVVVFIVSCDLFTTRDEEDPKNIGSTYVPPTTPQLLFENLKNSLSEKVNENYLASFVDSAFINSKFKYIAASGAASTFQTLADWDLSAERIYINNVFSSVQNGKIILLLINENSTPQGDSSIYFFDYSLNVPLSNPELPSVYGGSVEFVIKLDSRNQWVITTWRDIQKENLPSWSELRGRFY